MHWRSTSYWTVAANYAALGCNWVAVVLGPVRKDPQADVAGDKTKGPVGLAAFQGGFVPFLGLNPRLRGPRPQIGSLGCLKDGARGTGQGGHCFLSHPGARTSVVERSDMAEAIRVRLKILAEHAATPVRARDRHVREVMSMLGTEYEPARDYWKQPREAIRNSVGSRHTRRTLLSVAFKSKDPRRLKNYETARTEFVSWLDLYQPDSIWSPGVRELQLGRRDSHHQSGLCVSIGPTDLRCQRSI